MLAHEPAISISPLLAINTAALSKAFLSSTKFLIAGSRSLLDNLEAFDSFDSKSSQSNSTINSKRNEDKLSANLSSANSLSRDIVEKDFEFDNRSNQKTSSAENTQPVTYQWWQGIGDIMQSASEQLSSLRIDRDNLVDES